MTIWKNACAMGMITVLFAGAAFAQAATREPSEMVKAAQQALKDKGLDPGKVDGRMGPKTQAALREFQKARGMESTGELDAKTTDALGMDGKSTSSTATSSTSVSASPATAGAADDKKSDEKK